MWLLAVLLQPNLEPPRQIFAEMMSTTALVLMSLNLVLSARLRALEQFLYGLDKLFVTHRSIGLSIVLFIGAHFVVVPRSDGFVLTKAFSLPTFFLLLAAIAVSIAPRFAWGRLIPLKYHVWKVGHRFMGLFVASAVTHSLLAETYVRQVPFLAAYVYGMAGLGVAAWVYRETRLSSRGNTRRQRIEEFQVLGDVAEVTLSRHSELPRQAGQFAMLTLADGPAREQHPFTISSGPGDPYRFSIKSSGDFTGRLVLQGLRVGSDAKVEGPYGAFAHSSGQHQQLWLAGGIGITPFLAMAADLDDTIRVFLVWSVHDRSEAVYEDELTRLAQDRPSFRFMIHPTSERGHLDPAQLDVAASPQDYSVFICGPPEMRISFERQLRRIGVARNEIFFEEFRLR